MPSEPPAKGVRPERIGRYKIVNHIATGGMGSVYRARDAESGREVALKVMSQAVSGNAAVVERFRREASHASKLNHENIVKLYDWGEEGGVLFMALEFVNGIDLQEYIKRKGTLDVEESRRIIIQAVKALAQLNKQGIVHRDIKPSNFLVTQKDGKPFIKLIDLGLSRQVSSEEYRITRASFTLGTIDYMAPEQARDSGSADVRSDLYSLGCTWYHMLSGNPPFAEGSLIERLQKHSEAEIPNIRTLNRKVPERVVEILGKMLAKDPQERYQTPAELLRDLEQPLTVNPTEQQNALAQLAKGGEASAEPEGGKYRIGRDRSRKGERKGRELSQNWWIWVTEWWIWVAAGGVLVVAVVVLIAVLASGGKPPPTSPETNPLVETIPPLVPQEGVGTRPVPGFNTGKATEPTMRENTGKAAEPTMRENTGKAAEPTTKVKPEPPDKGKPPPPEPPLPVLYRPPGSFDAEAFRKELEQPWETGASPAPAPKVLVVSRGGGGENHYGSLAAALGAAGKDKEVVVEIRDNGPVFQEPASVTGHNVVVRGGKGYRPLLAWDWQNAPKANSFLSVTQGNLTLENLDVVLQCADLSPAEPATLFAIQEGNAWARDCTFSVAGKHRSGVTLIRLEGASKSEPGRYKCRLDRCYVRGAEVTALDLHAPDMEVLLNGCLLVGGDRTLIRIAGYNEPATSTLRLVRSTLVAGKTLIQVKPASVTDTSPSLHWVALDTLLAHSGTQAGGEMLALGEGANSQDMRWRAVNCFYAGWTLLLSQGGDSHPDLASWRRLWNQGEGDGATNQNWPPVFHPYPSEQLPEEYRTKGTEAGFAATSGPGTLGCDLAALPPPRENWLALTYEPFVPAQVDLPTGEPIPPPIPDSADGLYHGEDIHLAADDLGAHLQDVQKAKKLGPKVVLRLSGTGDQPTTPIRLRGTDLVLYFYPPADDAHAPLTLVPNRNLDADQKALIEVEDGNLEIMGGAIRFPDIKLAVIPAHVLQVRNGNLGLFHCLLQGPLAQPPTLYQGLIRFEGPGDPGRARGSIIHDSVLISSPVCFEGTGTDYQVHVRNCLLVSGGDAFRLAPGPSPRSRLNVQYVLEQATVAVKRAVVHLEDADLPVPAQPMVFQARYSVFLDPFADAPQHQAGLLRYEGEAFNRGLFDWQGQADVYDKRLDYEALPVSGTIPEKPQPHALWTHLWGTPGDRQPVEMQFTQTIDLSRALDPDHPQLDRLGLPSRPKGKLPGADLVQLGVKKLRIPR